MAVDDGSAMKKPTATSSAEAHLLDYHQQGAALTRELAVEAAVNIIYTPLPFAVMMASPGDLTDFAYGFSFTEGVIDAPSDILGVTLTQEPLGSRLEISLRPEKLHLHMARKRAMTGRTGCGLCGIEDLSALNLVSPRSIDEFHLSPQAIQRALQDLEAHQPLNARTRAVHAAAFADAAGHLLEVREDVGRHNALDKLIGALMRAGRGPEDGFIIITSRCSFEMVEKAARFGAKAIVAVSAPTSLAVERAKVHNMALVGVARADTALIFTGHTRIGDLEHA